MASATWLAPLTLLHSFNSILYYLYQLSNGFILFNLHFNSFFMEA